MNIREMKNKITIQELIKEDNAFGSGLWGDFKKVWSKKEFVKGKEFWSAKQNNALIPVKFIVRFRKDFKRNMRVVDKEGTYKITDIQPFNTKEFMTIYAEEVITSE